MFAEVSLAKQRSFSSLPTFSSSFSICDCNYVYDREKNIGEQRGVRFSRHSGFDCCTTRWFMRQYNFLWPFGAILGITQTYLNPSLATNSTKTSSLLAHTYKTYPAGIMGLLRSGVCFDVMIWLEEGGLGYLALLGQYSR